MNNRLLKLGMVVCIMLIVILTPKIPGFIDDIYCWIRWADAIRENGLRNVYDTDTNYLPLYHYVLWGFAKIAPDKEFLITHSYWLRYVTLLFDIAGLWLLYKWIDKKISFSVILIISLCNLAYIYDNIIWGQVDGILATLAFASIYYAYKADWLKGALCVVLMLNFKLQGIVFLPLYILVLLGQYKLKEWPKLIGKSMLIMALVQVLILLPFMFKPGGLEQISQTLTGLVGYFPKVSSLAYNLWTFVLGTNADTTPDSQIFIAGLSYKQAGLFLFLISSFISLWPLLHFVYQKSIKGKDLILPKEQVWVMSALIALGFFFFNTQMHERYSYPAFIFIAAYTFNRKDFIPYIIFSYVFFMNLEFVLRWLQLDNYGTFIFDRRFISVLYGVLMVYLWYRLYESYFLFRKTALKN